MLREKIALVPSSNHPFTEMWADAEYQEFLFGYLDNIRRLIENDNIIKPRNDVNIYLDGGLPENVAYPSVGIAKGLVRDGSKRLQGFVTFADPGKLIARARFELESKNSSTVFAVQSGQRIETALIRLSNGWY